MQNCLGGFILTLCFAVILTNSAVQQPVIGIYTLEPDTPPTPFPKDHTYLASSYIKNLEMAGAQVIPLFFHYSEAELEKVLSQINGVFFTGGNEQIDLTNHWTSNVYFIIEYAKKQNQQGNPYPIWATCLGFQAVMYVTSGYIDNSTIFSTIEDQDSVVETLKVYYSNSALMKTFSEEEYSAVTTGEGVFFYHHSYCVLKKSFDEVDSLQEFWHLVATSSNSKGVEFIAAAEAKQYPFFAVQFHPEKNNFEYRVPATRTYTSIRASQKIINHFVSIARTNHNVFANDAELKGRLIYNFQPIYLPIDYSGLTFVQIYEFDQSDFKNNPYGHIKKSEIRQQ